MNVRVTRRIHLAATPSTNTLVREFLAAGEDLPEMTLVDTDDQTAGRGQVGNGWESAAGQNLTFSLLCRPDAVLASEQFILSQAIALAVCLTLSRLADGFTVKWPNDIYFGDRKISGTLIECDLQGKHIRNCIVGTGVNVNQTDFKSDAPNPISLRQICGHAFDREQLLTDIIDEFVRQYERVQTRRFNDIRTAYMQHLYRREGIHRFADADGAFEAAIVGIEPTGHLLLRPRQGDVRRYEFKEVKFVLPPRFPAP